MPIEFTRKNSTGFATPSSFITVAQRLCQSRTECFGVHLADPASAAGSDLRGEADLRTNEYGHAAGHRLDYAEAKVFVVRRKRQQRCVTKSVSLCFPVQPAHKYNGFSRLFRFDPCL